MTSTEDSVVVYQSTLAGGENVIATLQFYATWQRHQRQRRERTDKIKSCRLLPLTEVESLVSSA